MKRHLHFLLLLSTLVPSCDKHSVLQQEVTALKSTVQSDQEAARQYGNDIAALGGSNALSKINQETPARQERIQLLEFENAARDRKWSAIETEFATLKPAAEAYKTAQAK